MEGSFRPQMKIAGLQHIKNELNDPAIFWVDICGKTSLYTWDMDVSQWDMDVSHWDLDVSQWDLDVSQWDMGVSHWDFTLSSL